MNIASSRKLAIRCAIRSSFGIASLCAGLLINPAIAADVQPQSDGLVSTLRDAAITTSVKAKLMSNSGLKNSDISVSTFNGVVTLRGVVSSAAAKSLAEADAKAIDKVKSIDASALIVADKKAK